MEDHLILNLYRARNEDAISETAKKYGKYCHTIAYNVLSSREDAEECVNDTYVRTWNTIPPEFPNCFSAFLGKITRNLALDRYHREHAQKRKGNLDLVYEELSECIPAEENASSTLDEIVLRDAINAFLSNLSPETRIMFLQRYWYLSPVRQIARDLDLTESNVKVTLHRTRMKFKAFLEKEGITI